jgi:hypothetical protein
MTEGRQGFTKIAILILLKLKALGCPELLLIILFS